MFSVLVMEVNCGSSQCLAIVVVMDESVKLNFSRLSCHETNDKGDINYQIFLRDIKYNKACAVEKSSYAN